MKRNPLYVFDDLNSIGISAVPIQSMIQINDADDLTPGSQPLLLQVIAKDGVSEGSTIRDFISLDTNFSNSSDTTEIPSELELVTQGGNTGWRILGVDSADYGIIGDKAIDLSFSDNSSFGTPYGATGMNSAAFGFKTMSQNSYSFAAGLGVISDKEAGTVIGKYNDNAVLDSIFEVGIGAGENNRRNGLIVHIDGTLSAPMANDTIIDSRGDKSLVTKEYVNNSDNLKVDKSGDIMTGDLIIQDSNLSAIKDLSGLGGTIYADGLLKIGSDVSSKSRVAFNNDAGQNIYYDNFRNGFFVDVSSNEGFALWHEGNDGINSGLDADMLDGLQPADLPVSVASQAALDLKYDIAGGVISGAVDIQSTLNVLNNVTVQGDLSVSNILTAINFAENIHATKEVSIDGALLANTNLRIGSDASGNSNLIFTDRVDLLARPMLYWENNIREFQIDTESTTGNTLWHAGNFDPTLKLDKIGGTISGNLGIQGTLDIGGISTFIGDVTANSNLNILGNSSFGGTVNVVGSTTLNGTLTVNNSADFGGIANFGSNANITGTLAITTDLNVFQNTSLSGTLQVQGQSTLNGDSTFGGNISAAGSINSVGHIVTLGTVSTGLDLVGNSPILFTDQLTADIPALFWDKTAREFYVDMDSTTVGGAFNIWHAGNFNPTDPTQVPKTFDDLIDTPTSKVGSANKFLTVSADETKVEYVNIPDISALWGNITGDINNQADLITMFGTKFDIAGGSINGLVSFNGAATFNAPAVFQNSIVSNGTTTLNGVTLLTDTFEVQGISTFGDTSIFNGLIDANFGLDVLGTSNFTGDVAVTADITSQQSIAGLNLTATNNLNVGNTLTVLLSSNLNGVITAGSDLNVAGNTNLSGNLDVIGATDFQGAVRVFNTFSVSQDTLLQLNTTIGQDLVIGQDLSVSGAATVTGNIATGSVTSGDITTTASSTVNINGVLNAQGATNFAINPTVGIDAIWHEGNLTPAVATVSGVSTGIATLDTNGLILSSQLPAIAITEVSVVADIPARDALVVQTGDVAKVVDSDGNGNPQTYIYDGTIWIDIQETSDVISVNGFTGVVSLTTADVAEGSNLYYTSVRAQADAAIQISVSSIDDLADVDTTTVLAVVNDGLSWDGANWIPDSRVTTNAADILLKEDSLGAPTVDGDILSSTIAGVRTWITPKVDSYVDIDAIAAQTDFIILGAVFTSADIHIDGLLQRDTTFTITDDGTDTTVTLGSAMVGGEWVHIAYKA